MTVNLTYWLRKSPQPAVVLADDNRIEVPRNRRAYRDLTETIRAMDPSKVTCLDAKGNVIRSIALDAADDAAPPPTAMTDEQANLQLFAKLLAQGYENGRSAAQPLLDSAMQFVDRQGQRLAKSETEIERLRMHIHKLNARIAELSAVEPMPEDDSGGGIMNTIIAGALQSGALKPAPVTQLNGAKK